MLDGDSEATHHQFYEEISLPYVLAGGELDEKSPHVRAHSPSEARCYTCSAVPRGTYRDPASRTSWDGRACVRHRWMMSVSGRREGSPGRWRRTGSRARPRRRAIYGSNLPRDCRFRGHASPPAFGRAHRADVGRAGSRRTRRPPKLARGQSIVGW